MSHAFELPEAIDATLAVAPPADASAPPADPSSPRGEGLEPEDRIEFHWSKRDERIRAAAKAWLESTHADP